MKRFMFSCSEDDKEVTFTFSTDDPEDVVNELDKFFNAISLEMPSDNSEQS